MTSCEPLFSPFKLKTLDLKNRVVMAPMTRSFSPGGVPTAEVAAYYRRRAEKGVGLIVTEGTGVARPASLNEPDIPRFHGEAELAGWKRVVDEVHAAGGLVAPQLWHVGAQRSLSLPDWTPATPYEGPSGYASPGEAFGATMSEADIADTIEAFARAAADARRLGFDAVELHGAHGYLIDQFFWGELNRRSDRYGGPSILERGRFAADILRAVRNAVGADYPVVIRISQSKLQDYKARIAHTPDEMGRWLGLLADAGADAFHCSQRRFWEPEFPEIDGERNLAGWAKALSGLPTITVGSVGLSGDMLASFSGEASRPASLDALLRRLERGEFDLVGVGRALLQDPAWVEKVREGRTHELSDFSVGALATLS